MKKTYKHLNEDERDQLAILRRELSLREIAKRLGRDVSTLSRELKRNAPPIRPGNYVPHQAHKRAQARKEESVRRTRLKSSRVRGYAARQLRRGWSPERIAGRLKKLGWTPTVCHEAIYQWIYEEARHLIPFLVRSHKRRKRKGYARRSKNHGIPGRVDISQRPEIVDQRTEIGHWEADTMLSGASPPVLQLAVERVTIYTRLNRLPSKSPGPMRKTLNRTLGSIPQSKRKTITYDNGGENTEHQLVNLKLGTQSFFCTPYTSQERGTVENTAGLVRRFFPKKTNFANVSKREIKRVEHWLNNLPRKRLGYLTPAEAFRSGVALPP